MGRAGFWDRPQEAQRVASELAKLKELVQPIEAFQRRVDDLQTLLELVSDGGDDAAAYEAEVAETAAKLLAEVGETEIRAFLSGPLDRNNAIVSVHAGAGGTESCDWADMLFRMYSRWAERRGYTMEIDDLMPGEQAGITKASFRILGPNAYGFIKAERGVHRLVRISPFDANKRRHTSFAAVDVIAEIEDDIPIELKEEELRIDTYRSSGKGGQHVNKTESAVRVTHLPTGLVAASQVERSQHKNKAAALKMLKSRLYEKLMDEKRAEMDKVYGEKGEIGWGNQIRSYVFQPYQLVKDLRTGVDTGNVQAVMDGDLDRFISAWLRAGCPRHRNKDIKMED